MKIPVGKFKGQNLADMETRYLAWMISQDGMRWAYFPLVAEAVRILRSRDLDAMLEELKMPTKPVKRVPAPEEMEKRAAERAEKLRILTKQRAEAKRIPAGKCADFSDLI